MLLDIDYIKHKESLQLKRQQDTTYIYDPIRRKYLVLQPEEIVRQLVLLYLIQECGYPQNFIRTEMGITVNERFKRTDILIYDSNFKPFLLVECKAAAIKINQDVFDQIARYNMPLQVPYLLVTNGRQSFCCAMDYTTKSYQILDHVPLYSSK